MEFHSLLKELGPGEDTRERDYGVIASADELRAWLAAMPRGRAGGGGHFEIGRRRVRAGHHRPGLARRARRAPCTAEHLAAPQAVAGRRARAQDRLRREIRAAGAGAAWESTARGFDHDVMLYAFLLDADPSGCALEEQARRRLDLKLGSAPGAARRYHAGALPAARAGGGRARPAQAVRRHRTAAGARAGAHGTHRHPHRSAPS